MSLARRVYYSCIIGGWAAFIAWLISELFVQRLNQNSGSSYLQTILTTALVGAAIGAGLNMVAGLASAQWKQIVLRVAPGLLGGGLGGACGGLLGNFLFVSLGDSSTLAWTVFLRALGFLVVGLGIGAVEGLYERSRSKVRNGLIGGSIGGLIGGLVFDLIQRLIASDMSSRATAFVILGLCIGLFIGLAQVVFKDAWLTVLDGYRTGRQLILSQAVTVLGRGDHLPLPFIGPMNQDLESEHLKIFRQPNGEFQLEDNLSKIGTLLNNKPVQGRISLKDGDVIKLGKNFVRFNERTRTVNHEPLATSNPVQVAPAPPPPSLRKQPAPPPPKSAASPAPPSPAVQVKRPEVGNAAAAPPKSIQPLKAPPPPPRRPAK